MSTDCRASPAAGDAGAILWLRRSLVAALVALATAGSVATAQASGPQVMIGDGTGGSRPGDAAELIAQAEARGRLPIIVMFDLAVQPEGALAGPQRDAQRAAIAAAQEALLDELAEPRNVKRYRSLASLAAHVTAADLARILAAPGVAAVHQDIAVPPLLNRSVPLIGAPALWRQGFRGEGQTVVVLDTGVFLDHNAFAGRIAAEACFSTNYTAGTVTVALSMCPGGVASSTDAGAGADCPLEVEGCGHGTHVAGIAVGNRIGWRGVATAAELIPIKVFSRFVRATDCPEGKAPCALSYPSDQLAALDHVIGLAAHTPVAAVNMSLGGGLFTVSCDSDPLKPAIDTLRSLNIPTVIAAGNEGVGGAVSAPGCISTAVTVGSTTKSDALSDFSNHSRRVDLLAPGSDIEAPIFVPGRPSEVGVDSGTSMAAPHVAGAWALLRQAVPDAGVDRIQRALACSGRRIPSPRIGAPGFTRARIDVGAALSFLRRGARDEQTWTFETREQFTDWTIETGYWRRVGGRKAPRMAVAMDPEFYISVANVDICAENLVVTARVRRIDMGGRGSGILLRAGFWRSEPPQERDVSIRGLLFGFTDFGEGQASIYAVFGASAAHPLIWRGEELCGNSQVTSIRKDGEFNTLRVISRGGQHRFLINGMEVCTASDSRFTGDGLAILAIHDTLDSRMEVHRVVATPLR
ncbi:MAG: S8 family serine peptidase [Rhodobacteraceae bacterium]|jgi:hypothetical protein|nr:S8 family serine peptidase [Paracoccaceae bacterium]